jgi:predicted branched-subunit amino acid permease
MNDLREYKAGVLAGLPIMLGYISVSFGIGILAHQAGLTTLQAALMSGANLTSAGEAAGIDIIASHGTMLEMAMTQLVINFR